MFFTLPLKMDRLGKKKYSGVADKTKTNHHNPLSLQTFPLHHHTSWGRVQKKKNGKISTFGG